jgi:hypothetical protein
LAVGAGVGEAVGLALGEGAGEAAAPAPAAARNAHTANAPARNEKPTCINEPSEK